MVCDKCGKPVDLKNDATMVAGIVFKSLGMMFCKPRHFLPTEDCEGSPGGAQYIEGQPRVARGYEYVKKYEQLYRDAYKQLQEMEIA